MKRDRRSKHVREVRHFAGTRSHPSFALRRPVGQDGRDVIKYFADRGVVCPPSKNVAEFILETAAKGGKRNKQGKRVDWNKEWVESNEYKDIQKEIQHLKEERSKLPPPSLSE